MKSLKIAIPVFFFCIIGCKKEEPEETTTTVNTVTEEDAADLIASTLAEESYGETTKMADAASFTNTTLALPTPCSYSNDSVFTVASTSGSAIAYSFSMDYYYFVTCTSMVPQKLTYYMHTNGSITAPRLNYTGHTYDTLYVDSLSASTNYKIAGKIVRDGNTSIQVRTGMDFSSNLVVTINEIYINKSTYAISSGSGSFTLAGSDSNGNTFSFSGSLTYSAGNIAVITIGAKTFTVNLTSGSVL